MNPMRLLHLPAPQSPEQHYSPKIVGDDWREALLLPLHQPLGQIAILH
jgi:hypothetical protein